MNAATVDTHCPYCALQCGMGLRPAGPGTGTAAGARAAGAPAAGGPGVEVVERPGFPVNRGALCGKGRTAAELLAPGSAADHAAGAERRYRDAGAGRLGRGAGPGRRGPAADRRGVRPGRGGCLRRRRAHQREGVHPGEVRPGRARHLADRLQRPVLHVVGRRGARPGVRTGPRSAVPAGGRGPHRLRHPGRLQPGRDHAARAALPHRAAGERRQADRHRPAQDPHRRAGGPAPRAAPRHRSGAGARAAAPGRRAGPHR